MRLCGGYHDFGYLTGLLDDSTEIFSSVHPLDIIKVDWLHSFGPSTFARDREARFLRRHFEEGSFYRLFLWGLPLIAIELQ